MSTKSKETRFHEAMDRAVLDRIVNRKWPYKSKWTAVEYESNHAEPGPNNLVRHRVGEHCVGHGDTWDYIERDFC